VTNVERLRRADEIIQAALECGNGELAALLDAECAGDALLRTEVESLLGYRARAKNFIETPAFALGAELFAGGNYCDDLGDEGACVEGRRIGSYQVVREIGRGGMGAVYLSERADGEFRQQVAVKIIRQTLAGAETRRHFKRERQILASLNHPNIARLLDGGVSADGEPFLAMEYVEGVRIDEYADAHGLSITARLGLFRQVCAAVQYAHQNLIIHRDLKPSNILVTNEGVPKLLDFGIAKLLDPNHAGDQTRTEMRAFTPDYAAPEQVAGAPVTTASDVYSLGVLLDDLLRASSAGRGARRRFPGGWRTRSAGATIATNLPTDGEDRNVGPKSSTQTFVNPELKNIVAMARREDPARRYASVAQFADDVQRYLDGQPVRAQKDSFTYRAGKFIRRNKVSVVAAALVLLSLFVGFAVAIWQARRATAQATLAAAERDRARRRFDDVRQLSNALLNDIAPKIERLEGSTEARQALVTQSLKYLDSLAGESADDLVLQAELAAAYEKVGVLQGDSRRASLSDFRGAIASLEKAQAVRRRLLAINPNDAGNRRLLADNLRLLALRRMAQTDVEGGFRDSTEALQIYEKLVAETPGSLELQRAFLEAQVEDAGSYTNLNRDAEGIPLLQRAAVKIEELRRTNADDAETQRILARCLASLGVALSWESRQPEAEAAMTRAVAIAASLAARFPNDTNLKLELWKTYESASSIYEQIDDARAFELCEKSRRVVEEIIAADPANAQARHNLSKSFSRLGVSASHLGKPVAALGFLERAKAIVLELQKKDSLNRGYDRDASALHIRIGLARLKQRDFTGALAAFEKSAELYEKQLAADAANTIALRDSAIAYRHAGLVHKELAKTNNPQTRQMHLAAEQENYQRALDALLKADAQKALPDFSRKLIDTYRKDIEELEKLR